MLGREAQITGLPRIRRCSEGHSGMPNECQPSTGEGAATRGRAPRRSPSTPSPPPRSPRGPNLRQHDSAVAAHREGLGTARGMACVLWPTTRHAHSAAKFRRGVCPARACWSSRASRTRRDGLGQIQDRSARRGRPPLWPGPPQPPPVWAPQAPLSKGRWGQGLAQALPPIKTTRAAFTANAPVCGGALRAALRPGRCAGAPEDGANRRPLLFPRRSRPCAGTRRRADRFASKPRRGQKRGGAPRCQG